jgi:hypothetical protein
LLTPISKSTPAGVKCPTTCCVPATSPRRGLTSSTRLRTRALRQETPTRCGRLSTGPANTSGSLSRTVACGGVPFATGWRRASRVRPKTMGTFWLTCEREWSDRSVDGKRQLFMSELPGVVTTVSGFRGTVCRPEGWHAILRVIRNKEDVHALAVRQAREAYERATAELIGQLREKDFELLVDLILSRDGWARIGPLAGSMADIDNRGRESIVE